MSENILLLKLNLISTSFLFNLIFLTKNKIVFIYYFNEVNLKINSIKNIKLQ